MREKDQQWTSGMKWEYSSTAADFFTIIRSFLEARENWGSMGDG
jgi:hypothetical protein